MDLPAPSSIDVNREIEKFFQDPSLTPAEAPKAVILCGGMCVGKTTLRKEKFSAGYVVLDAAEIFLNLTGSAEPRFPGPLMDPLWEIGRGVFLRAANQRLNLVTEVIGAEPSMHKAMTDVLLA